MKPVFYSGSSGLIAYQEALNTVGNNLSNANTPGYQKQNVTFEDLLYKNIYANTTKEKLNGSGVRVASQGIEFGLGSPEISGGQLDFCISGDGLFAVEKDGVVSYTRDGSFGISLEGDTPYLTTSDGAYVLDSGGGHIEISRLSFKSGDKTVESGEFDYAKLMEDIGVYHFDNPNGLQPMQGNRYQAGEASGEPQEAEDGTFQIMRGYLESSGASLADGMTEMILMQRAFQLSARVVQTGDQLEEIINNLRS